MSEEQNQPAVRERDSRYYLGLDEWMKDPEFQSYVENEFQSSPIREGSEKEEGWARREFLKLMGASMAMASAGCIRRPVQKIVPYNKQPEEVTFGINNFYTSTWSDGQDFATLLVRTREGRPLKYEGNPQNPFHKSGLSARAQSHLLSLYDPERLKGPVKNIFNKDRTSRDTVTVKWDEADDAITAEIAKGQVGILTGQITGPSQKAVVLDFVNAFNASHFVWDGLNQDALLKANQKCYSTSDMPFLRFDKAKMIVSVDADFLGTWMSSTTFMSQFAEARKLNHSSMNQLVVFDSAYSLTGANADIRFRIKPSDQLWVLMGLAYELIVNQKKSKFSEDKDIINTLQPFAKAPERLKISQNVFAQMAKDLWAVKGESLIVTGGLALNHAQGEMVAIAACLLNEALENEGSTIDSNHLMLGMTASDTNLIKLIEQIENGQIKRLVIHNQNAVYASVLGARFEMALKKLDMIVYCGDRVDETGRMAHFVLPDLHAMESWSDLEPVDGVYAIHQPTIRPMYDLRSFGLTLMTWGYLTKKGPSRFKDIETYYDYLKTIIKDEVLQKYAKGKSFDTFWDELLQKGFVALPDFDKTGSKRKLNKLAFSEVKPLNAGLEGLQAAASLDLELVPYATIMFKEGSLSNVSWLHELPDPITKICWDNYAQISIALAEKLKVKEGQLLDLAVNGKQVTLPAHIQPGLHDQVVAVAVGYGRTAAGQVGNGIGQNIYHLGQLEQNQIQFSGQKVTIQVTKKDYPLACVQSHHAMEGRQIVAEVTLAEYLKNKSAGLHKHHIFSIWPAHKYNGHKWGMAIDLNSCTGCSACMVACQAENNIPVVGKKYILQGREMHWIRMDRYYVGNPSDAEIVFQPVMCQHCDNAPCETVCPVLATVHSDEGLNDMVYNRCVGTRYCSNNCPYKVRRFNWFSYTHKIDKPLHLALNPDVTVRMRGVMEKCTFCTHRIKSTKIELKTQGETYKDGDIKTACQETCPTGAIVFGDLNDPESEVSKMFFKDERSYALLEEFHAAPSVRYLTKIRNNGQPNRHNESHS